MRTKILSILILIAFAVPQLHAQSIVWAKQFGTAGIGNAAGSDAAGNVYVTGVIGGDPALFDDDTLAANFADIFIAKYNAAGTVQWEKVMGNVLVDAGDDIYTDAAGNSYITGYYRTNGVFPTVNFDGTTLTGFGDVDFFVAKYNASGALQWVKNGGGTSTDIATGIEGDADGNIYLCGYFTGTISFLGSTVSTSGGFSSDVFIAKLTTDGTLSWLKREGGSGFDYAFDITTDNSGNVAVTGEFAGTTNFDGITATASGINDIYICKLDNTGTAIWLKKAGSNQTVNTEKGNNITHDASGNFYVTGEFVKTASFAPLSVTANGPTATDIFTAKYNNAGTIQWVHNGGGVDADAANGITVDADNNVFITGFADSGPGVKFDAIELPPLGNEYVYLAKYNNAGTVQYVNQYSAGVGEGVHAIAGNCLYITGAQSGTSFGGVPTPFVDRDGFIANYCESSAGCTVPGGLHVTNIKATSAKINWDVVAGAVSYKLQYRQTGTLAWTNKNSATNSKKITGLAPSTSYDYRVRTVCGTDLSAFSDIHTFTTMPMRMADVSAEQTVTAYPNPCNGEATISYSGLGENITAEAYTTDGRKIQDVLMQNLADEKLQISLPHIEGIYIIRLSGDEGTEAVQIIVE